MTVTTNFGERTLSRICTSVGLVALATLLLSCSEDLIRNAEIERWCGDTPCDWEITGEVKQVGSWHPNDYAIALVSDDAQLSQENATVSSGDADCFEFALVAKINRGVRVYLELDFLADGNVEFSQQLPQSDWERRTFKVTAPEWYQKVRFTIRKDGPGTAIVAEISAVDAGDRCTAPPVELLNRPDGARCSDDAQCAGGECRDRVCGSCEDDSSCQEGEVCGLGGLAGELYHACMPQGDTPLGAACDSGAQCQSGICSERACSECDTDADCEGDMRCNFARYQPTSAAFWPKLCGAGGRAREDGSECATDLDCSSEVCVGFTQTCEYSAECRNSFSGCSTCVPEIELGRCQSPSSL